MAQRHLRSAATPDQEFTTPQTRRSGRIAQGNASLSAQSSSRQQAVDKNPRSQSRKGKRRQPSDDLQSTGSSKRATTGTSEPRSNDPASSNPATYPRSRSRKGKRKQPPDGSQSPEGSKRATTGSGVLTVGTSEPQSINPTSSNLRPKCFRISGLPLSWSENDLFDALHDNDPSLTRQSYRPSLYPACFGSKQTALLYLDPSTEHLHSHNHLQVSESASRTATVLTIDSDFHNLTPLNDPKGDIVADVIAVTGLAGHAFGSWRNRKTHQMWLKDLLPHDVQNIRIMTYGYDSRLVGQGKAENRLLDYQRLFIQDIENARSSVKKTRPIIFIGHSLGGILILQVSVTCIQKPISKTQTYVAPQALIECKRNRSHTHILDAMHSIIFFGTPHNGMRTDDLEQMVDMESGGYETSRHNLLRQLREGSEFLETQKEDLSYIWDEYKPKIISFYETVQTPTVKRSDSGSYGRDGKESEMRVPVEENHTNMVKFASTEDPTYQTVVRYLKEWVDSISELYVASIKIQNLQKSQEYIDCRKSLKPSDYESYREEIWLRRHKNTCTWVLDDQHYRGWAEKNGNAILWISGDPGCGKCVLSSFLTKEITRGKPNQLYIAYFFCDDKDERLRTAHSILVNLLTQLLDQVPDIIAHFLADPEYSTNKEKTLWSFGMLWRVFERIINGAHHGQVYILIDALDECEEGSRTKLLNKLKHLFHNPTTTIPPIKIIITSRPHIPVAFYLTDVIEMRLAAENLKNDITAFVEAEVHTQPQFTGDLGEEVRQALIDGANGMFLWVSLILDDLKKSTNTTPRAIRKALKVLPPDLPGVYINILRKIRSEDQQTAQVILQWVVWAMRPLTLQELTIAIAILPEHTSMVSMQDDMQTDLKQVLRFIFGPMLRVEDDDTVHLVHQSAKDFLSSINIVTDGGVLLCALSTSSAKSNMHLAVSCLVYLLFEECESGPVTGKYIWEPNVRKRIKILQHKLPFLDYAATHWPAHARQADRCDESQVLRNAFRKLAESPRKMDLAYQIFSFSHQTEFQKTAPLQIVSSLGLIAFAEQLLDHGDDVNVQSGIYGNALVAAAQRGHEAIVRLLVDRSAINAQHRDYGNALKGAIDGGHEAIVRLLNTRPGIHITKAAIIAAAENSNGKEMMEMLLSAHPDIKITESIVMATVRNSDCGQEVMEMLLSARPNIEITEPIVTAAAGNSRSGQVMKMLLSARPDIEVTEPIVTAAAWNSRSGEVMKMLLSARPDIEITEPIVTAAAENNDCGQEVMEMLLYARPDIEVTEPIVKAAARNNGSGKEVMEVLLSARPDIEITEPIVMAAARNNGCGQEVMEVLLSTRNSSRGKEVMEMLLSARPDIEITEPIVTAAAGNRWRGKEVMEVLLSARPDIEITGPIVTAAAGNWNSGKEVMEMLLSARPEIKITEPIVTAAAGNLISGKEVMEMLLSAHPDIKITEPIVTATAGNDHCGQEVMEVLLSACPDIEITEPIVMAAARNNDCGQEVMEVLLSARPDIEITEPIVKAAVKNWNSDKVMEVLLSARPDIEITEPIVTAVAGNQRWGKKVMEMLLSARPDIEITEPIVTAAAGNSGSGHEVMQMLLDSDRKCRVYSSSVNTVAYFGMVDYTKTLLAKCNKIILNEKYMQLVHAAVEGGVADILKTSLELGGNYSSPDEHNWTVYMTASQSRNAFALQQFTDTQYPSFDSVVPPGERVSEQACVSIQLQEDKAELFYSGASKSTQCSVKDDHPFPPGNLGTNYFEVTVIESSPKLDVGVGFCGEHILQSKAAYSYCFSSV
ncbi:hypothetical protein BDD12DRAFT_914734 [Trichophaea hybrida]|nr:hypothetical protein BDD12DRAFT_914734 [Trichophaea hybrida]